MARTDSALLVHKGPAIPAMGTFPTSANSLYPKGTIVTQSSAGRAVAPATADLSGNPAVGVSKATYNNLTGAEMGGLDDSGLVEVDYGVFFFAYTGAAPLTGQVLYVVDNQTVSVDPSTGRGVAGICTEVRTLNGTAKAGVFMGPAASSEAVASASELLIPIPLTELRLAANGGPIIAFGDGTADGFQLTDSEALSLRINDDSTTAFACTIPLVDHDDSQDLVLHVTGFRVGSADVADVALTVGAFFHTIGAAHTADANAGGETTAFTAATTIVSEETLTIAAADIPAGPCTLTLTFVVTSELDADDLCLLGMWLTGAKK
jgi:hypothetical protein